MFTPVAVALHALAAAVWVGGMFFAYLAMRPAAGALSPADRLPLFANAFGRFFGWVWVAILVLLGTGYWLIFSVFGGMAGVGLHVHLMHGIGLIMVLLFMHLYFAPFRRLRRAVQAQDWPSGAAAVAQIRVIVLVNLILGLSVVAIGASGRYW